MRDVPQMDMSSKSPELEAEESVCYMVMAAKPGGNTDLYNIPALQIRAREWTKSVRSSQAGSTHALVLCNVKPWTRTPASMFSKMVGDRIAAGLLNQSTSQPDCRDSMDPF